MVKIIFLVFLSFFIFKTQAQQSCDSMVDKTSDLRTTLDSQGYASIPAGELWRVDGLELKSGEKLSGHGTICKSKSSSVSVEVIGTGVTIENLTFIPQTVSGQPNCDIKLGEGSKDIRIMSNHFKGSSYSAICGADDSAVGGAPYITPAKGIMVSDNTFTGYVRPIFLHSVDNISISNNIIRDTLRDGIRLRENDGFALITGNQFFNIGDGVVQTDTQDAIDTFWGGNRLVITDNIVRTTQSMGFDIKGVSPNAGDIGSRSVIVANNHISDTLYSGIVLHGNLDTGEANHTVIVEGNIIEGATRNKTYADAAIWAKGAIKYLTIANNQLRSNYARGITIQTRTGSNDGTVVGVHVTGNTILNNGVITAPSSIGLFINGIQGAIVSNNTIGNDFTLENPSTRYGIYATNIVDGLFKNNILRCNSTNSITVSGNNVINSDNISASVGCPSP